MLPIASTGATTVIITSSCNSVSSTRTFNVELILTTLNEIDLQTESYLLSPLYIASILYVPEALIGNNNIPLVPNTV